MLPIPAGLALHDIHRTRLEDDLERLFPGMLAVRVPPKPHPADRSERDADDHFELRYVKFAPHAMEHIHSHLVSASHNSLFVERLTLFEEITHKIFANAPVPVKGYLPIPDGPGLGLELNMDFIRLKDEV